mgnify:CR=1 FL=1
MSNQSENVLLAYDNIEITPRIVADNNRFLKVEAVISRTGVYKYDDGMALKCTSELKKATRTARYAKLTLNDHPETKVIMSQQDLYGGVERPFFDNNKMRAVLSFDKQFVSDAVLTQIRSGALKDVSIGFYYRPDFTPGWARDVNTDKPKHYDYIMRDIMIDHVVGGVGPGMRGRCTFPQCGIGLNTMMKTLSIGEDKVEKRGSQWCVIHCHGPDTGKPIKCFPTKEQAEAMHRAIQAHKAQSNVDMMVALSSMDIDILGLDSESYKLLFGDAEKPSKQWMDNCTSKAQNFASDPGAFCGWVWYHGPETLKKSFGSSSVSVKGVKTNMSEEQETEYTKCIREKKAEGMTDEEAREACKAKKTDQEKLQSAYEKCLAEKKAEGMTDEEAEKACEALKPTASDQEKPEKTPWQLCLQKHMAEGLTKEQARMKCKEEGVKGPGQDQTTEEPAVPQETLPTPLEECIATRMEAHGEDEATAKKWCEDELAGLHQPTADIIDRIEQLKTKERQLKKR